MKLQIAIDLADTQTALAMAEQIYDVIDIVEIGTPMIMREGLAPVRLLKEKFPSLTVLADTKIVDGGEIESGDAFTAGADIVTVLGVAADETIKAVVDTARKYGRKAMADMISVTNTVERAAELDRMGLDYICVHTAVDVQGTGRSPLEELRKVTAVLQNAQAAVAGGISMKSLEAVRGMSPSIVVAGGALTKAEDLRGAVMEMRAALLQAGEQGREDAGN